MDRPRVLLLMPTTTYRAEDFIEAAGKLGVDVVVGSEQRQTLEQAVPSAMLTLNFEDLPSAAAEIARFARSYPLRCIVGVEDETTVLAADAARILGLPHNPVAAVQASRDKHAIRERFRQAGLRVPRFERFAATEPPDNLVHRIEYPCVLKPLALAASRGVIRADDPAAFVAAWRRVVKILEGAEAKRKGGSAGEWILVESYVPGREVALEGLLVAGALRTLALFDKPDPLEGPFFEETLYVTPSRLAEETQAEIRRVGSLAAGALGLIEGPVHAELRLNEQGVWPLELAARSIGGLCARALRFGAGISLEELILRHALGLEIEGLRREANAAGVMMIPIPGAGRLKRFAGISEAMAVPGVEQVVQSIPLGQEVVPLPEGSRYLGFIFARGEDPASVERSLREAHHRLSIEVTP
jgi:biotin carboxylase